MNDGSSNEKTNPDSAGPERRSGTLYGLVNPQSSLLNTLLAVIRELEVETERQQGADGWEWGRETQWMRGKERKDRSVVGVELPAVSSRLPLLLLVCNNLSDRWLPRQPGFLQPHKWSVWHFCHFHRSPMLLRTLHVHKDEHWETPAWSLLVQVHCFDFPHSIQMNKWLYKYCSRYDNSRK